MALGAAFDLFLSLQFQTSNYEILAMKAVEDGIRQTFVETFMEDITGEDEESLPGRKLMAIFSPLVCKDTNEDGILVSATTHVLHLASTDIPIA